MHLQRYLLSAIITIGLVFIVRSLRTSCTGVPKNDVATTAQMGLMMPRINITYFARNLSELYSIHRCCGDENHIDNVRDRACVFNDICFHVPSEKFQYFRRLNVNGEKPIFYDVSKRMLKTFPTEPARFAAISMPRAQQFWAPDMISRPYPIRNSTRLTHVHQLWKEAYLDYNYGHAVWEEFAAIFYVMERTNEVDNQSIILYAGTLPKHPGFVRLEKFIRPVITPNPIKEFQSYVRSFQTEYVCFDRFLVGGHLYFFDQAGKEYHEVELLLYKWRNRIMTFYGLDPKYIPKQHKFTIVNKTSSHVSFVRRRIANLKEIVDFIRATYPSIPVEVVEWQHIDPVDQLRKLATTTILISPAGAVATKVPFLSHGTHAIIADNYVSQDYFFLRKGESGSLERQFLQHWSHVRKLYYQVDGLQDHVWDHAGASDAQNSASTVFDVTRLKLLVDSALENMQA